MALDRRSLALLSVVASLALGSMGAASLAASLVAAGSEDVVDRLRRGQSVPKPRLVAAARSSARAAKIFETARHSTNSAVALSHLDLADRMVLADGGTELHGLLENALRKAPYSANNWARLASFRFHQGNIDGAEQALLRSVEVSRHAPRIAAPRAALGFAMLRPGDRDLADAVNEQIRIAGSNDPEALAHFTGDAGFERLCIEVLAADPWASRAYRKAMKRKKHRA